MIDALSNIPDITFIEDLEVTDVQEQLIKDYQEKYEEITEETVTLAKADPYRIILNACAILEYQMLKYIDEMGKQNLLKYAESAFLDQIGALRGIKRLEGSKAVTTIRFTLSEARECVTPIAKGTRVAGGDYFFQTTEYAEVATGNIYVDVLAECTEIGAAANDLMAGEVNSIVDSVAFVASASNITATSGGADEETDENFTDRIYLAPSKYSSAGPEDAYKYFVKEANAKISNVTVKSPSPGVVDIRFVLNEGEIPTDDAIKEVLEYVSATDIRPLTDNVTVAAPDIVEYEIELEYWIADEKKSVVSLIQEAVERAVNEYIIWQNSIIGRDINPSELICRVMQAGAKRVEVISPVFEKVNETSIAKNTKLSFVYGGVESD